MSVLFYIIYRFSVAYNRIEIILRKGASPLSDQTVQPTIEEHLLRLSRRAEELRGRLASHRATLARAQVDLPEGVLEGLRQLGGPLLQMQKTVKEHEHDRRNLQALTEIGKVVNSFRPYPRISMLNYSGFLFFRYVFFIYLLNSSQQFIG
ncbi:MAG: hypothetical protein KAT23_06035 [Anaerolineales bacterium]|nr:hypothetical protein [Anaerolineales bacterium]